MISALVLIFSCQLLGEVLVRSLRVPLPGPVVGMGLLFVILLVRGRKGDATKLAVPEKLATVADGLLANLALLFVPAAVGIIQHFGLLRVYGVAIVVALAGSTCLALVITALVFEAVDNRFNRQKPETEP